MNKRQGGFTLIEVLVVAALVGILAAIAIPSYEKFINKSRRADGKGLAIDLVAREERFFMQKNTYTTDITTTSGLDRPATSKEGFYAATVATCGSGTIATCYEVTVTAVGVQLNRDRDCKTLKLDHTGLKSSTDYSDAASTGCW